MYVCCDPIPLINTASSFFIDCSVYLFYSFYFYGIFYGSCGLMQIKMMMMIACSGLSVYTAVTDVTVHGYLNYCSLYDNRK